MSKELEILKSILNECQKHYDRINFAFHEVNYLFPIEKEAISNLKKEEITFIDQLIYRFTKLQDAIGQKLFKAVLINLDEDVINKSAIDIFNRLEQLEIIEDYEKWKSLRNFRNELAHQYEDNDEELVDKLNLLAEKISDLEKYLLDITKYAEKRGWAKL